MESIVRIVIGSPIAVTVDRGIDIDCIRDDLAQGVTGDKPNAATSGEQRDCPEGIDRGIAPENRLQRPSILCNRGRRKCSCSEYEEEHSCTNAEKEVGEKAHRRKN